MLTPITRAHLYQATLESLYIITVSGGVSLLLGLSFGTLLYHIKGKTSRLAWVCYKLLNGVVNLGRSVPFIILLIALIPFTRLLLGSSIGTNAAIVPLIVAATPFYARVVVNGLTALPAYVNQTAEALAATPWQRLHGFLIPEATPELIRGATLTLINLVGYSAMAGTVGGGGLGQLAIDYGYEQFNTPLIIATVVILVAFVQLIQWAGDHLASNKPGPQRTASLLLLLAGFVVSLLLYNIHWRALPPSTLRLGVMGGEEAACLQTVVKEAWQHDHLKVKLVTFNDYALPNRALNEGDIDANVFQHTPFLKADVKAHQYAIKAIAKTFLYPLAFYSKTIHHIHALPDHAIIAIANDPSNQSRALQLLARYHVIQLNVNKAQLASLDNITANPHHLRIKTLDTAQLPRALQDASLVAINNAFVAKAGLNAHDAIIHEDADVPYINVLVVRKNEAKQKKWRALIKALHSPAFIQKTEQRFPGAVVGWET